MCSDVLPSNYHSSLSQLSNHGGSPRLQQYILVNQPTLNHYSPNLFYSLPNNQWHCPTRLFCPFIRHCRPESHRHQRHQKKRSAISTLLHTLSHPVVVPPTSYCFPSALKHETAALERFKLDQKKVSYHVFRYSNASKYTLTSPFSHKLMFGPSLCTVPPNSNGKRPNT
jgi:hypothetical protein